MIYQTPFNYMNIQLRLHITNNTNKNLTEKNEYCNQNNDCDHK